jgi:hypothetical protein
MMKFGNSGPYPVWQVPISPHWYVPLYTAEKEIPIAEPTIKMKVFYKFMWVVHPFLDQRWAIPGEVAKIEIQRVNTKSQKLEHLREYYHHESASEQERQNILCRIADVKKSLREAKIKATALLSTDRMELFEQNIEDMFDGLYGWWTGRYDEHPKLVVYAENQQIGDEWVNLAIDYADDYKRVPRRLTD